MTLVRRIVVWYCIFKVTVIAALSSNLIIASRLQVNQFAGQARKDVKGRALNDVGIEKPKHFITNFVRLQKVK